MKNLLIIGPLPPPIHGESLALKAVEESEEMKSNYNINTLNTNRKVVENAGRFSFKKIYEDVICILKLFYLTFFTKIEIVYISISQTKLGLFRDCIFIFICCLKNKKIITHLHGNNLGNVIDSLNKFEKYFVKKSLAKVHTGIVLGKTLKDNYRGLVENIEVVSNGVDKEFITDDELINKNNNKKSLRILYLSNLIESKGYIELINAVMALLKEHYDISLILAGQIYNPKKFDEIWNEVCLNSFEERIKYIGIVSGTKKKELLIHSDVFVLPTSYKIEGQPLSIIEAMAAGNIIISSNKGCIPDMIEDNGYILEDPSALAIEETLHRILENTENRKKMGRNSREVYLKRYTLDKYIKKLSDIFAKN